MRKIDLIQLGLFPLGGSVLFYMISYFTQNKILFGLMSIAFMLMWSYTGYKIGKDSKEPFSDIVFAHLMPIVFILLQFGGILYSRVRGVYSPILFSQLYFLPIANLINSLFSFTTEIVVIVSFIVMIAVFSVGFFKGKVDG